MIRQLLSILGFSRFKRSSLLPLPKHPSRGIRVEKGDKLTTSLSISFHDSNEDRSKSGTPIRIRLLKEANNYGSGASFGLKRRLEKIRYNVNENLVYIDEDERTIHVLLKESLDKPFARACDLVEKILDLISVESFRNSELDDPLREYSTWTKTSDNTILRFVTTNRLAVRFRSNIEVKNQGGQKRNGTKSPTLRWYPSFAYFRQSQLADNLHDAYRNLFLALESLLSEVYPWYHGVSENRWLKDALRYVIEGYAISLNDFVEGDGGNPYRRFMKEQYKARRCALFHSKVGEGPTIPGELFNRVELAAATRRLGKLYMRIAQLITGVRFAGGTMSSAGFERMMEAFKDTPLYVSPNKHFDEKSIFTANSSLIRRFNGDPGLCQQIASWKVNDQLKMNRIKRVGSLLFKNGNINEGSYAEVDIDLYSVDIFELVIQTELENAEHLREWFL